MNSQIFQKNNLKTFISPDSLNLLDKTHWVLYTLVTLDRLVQVDVYAVQYWFVSCNDWTHVKNPIHDSKKNTTNISQRSGYHIIVIYNNKIKNL